MKPYILSPELFLEQNFEQQIQWLHLVYKGSFFSSGIHQYKAYR
jgi:hypothetical protein